MKNILDNFVKEFNISYLKYNIILASLDAFTFEFFLASIQTSKLNIFIIYITDISKINKVNFLNKYNKYKIIFFVDNPNVIEITSNINYFTLSKSYVLVNEYNKFENFNELILNTITLLTTSKIGSSYLLKRFNENCVIYKVILC